MTAAGITLDTAVRASGTALPFRDNSVDIFIPPTWPKHRAPLEMAEEMVQGCTQLAVISYTEWLGPFGGHEQGCGRIISVGISPGVVTNKHGNPLKTSGAFAFRRLRPRKPRLGSGMRLPYLLLPRYHPSWAWWIDEDTRVAGVGHFKPR